MSDPTPCVHLTGPHVSYRNEGWERFNSCSGESRCDGPRHLEQPAPLDVEVFLRLLMEDIWAIGDSRKYGLLGSNASLTQALTSAIRMSLH